MDQNAKAIAEVVGYTANLGYKRATKYLSSTLTVKATRRFRPHKRARYNEVVLTIGQPNYREREFIRQCKATGESFPVKKIQLQHYPVKKRK